MSILDIQLELPDPPRQIDGKNISLVAFDLEINSVVDTKKARDRFKVDGNGLTVAVFDTGLNSGHNCFTGRVINGVNFSSELGADNTSDNNGHGTNVTGLIAGKGASEFDPLDGIATASKVLPVKVLPGSFDGIVKGLQWVFDNQQKYAISAINLSLGAPNTNYSDYEGQLENDDGAAKLSDIINKLTERRVAVIIAAGNDYAKFNDEGMAYPAIIKECISVGAVYDADVGSREYRSGAKATSTAMDQITPFTQRLSSEVNGKCFTTIFAPGASATSAGIGSSSATSVQDGTSQAAPTVTGVVLLIQEFVKRQSGELPDIAFIKNCLRSSSHFVKDSDRGVDNVKNTERVFPRLSALDSLIAAQSALTLKALTSP